MPSNRRILGLAALAAATLASGQAFAASDPTGVWMNDTGRGAVEIRQCGEGLCGHVVWVKDTGDAKGCGRQILGNVMPVGDGTWDNGWVYSPERKKKYDVELKPLADGNLRVKGYAGTKLFSKTMIWTPAPADLVRCGAEQVAAAPAEAAKPETATVVKAASVEELKFRTKTESAAEGSKVATAVEPAKPASDASAAPAVGAGSNPSPEQEVATDDPGASEGSELADALGEFLKKGADGSCKLDLPWVKIDFQCQGNDVK